MNNPNIAPNNIDLYKQPEDSGKNNWAAVTSFSIVFVEIGGIVSAFLFKYFGHFLYGIKIPLAGHPADNVVIDTMINWLIDATNRVISASLPVLDDFFKFFFSTTLARTFIVLSIFAFIFGIIGLKSEKNKLAATAIIFSLIILIFYWWIISQANKGIYL